MDATSRASLWDQFGAAIDMLENAIRACPDELWGNTERHTQFWHIAYHTLFYLDLGLSDSGKGFAPPPPFTLSELDPSGVLPERVYSQTVSVWESLLLNMRHVQHHAAQLNLLLRQANHPVPSWVARSG